MFFHEILIRFTHTNTISLKGRIIAFSYVHKIYNYSTWVLPFFMTNYLTLTLKTEYFFIGLTKDKT